MCSNCYKWLAGRVGKKKKELGACCGLRGEDLSYDINIQTAANKAWMVFQCEWKLVTSCMADASTSSSEGRMPWGVEAYII